MSTEGPDAPIYRPDQLLGARHDGPDHTGEVVDWEPDSGTDPLAAALTGGLREIGPVIVTGESERLGRLVRDVWVAWACERENPKNSWLVPWDELDDSQREVDIRIGEAVAIAVRAQSRLDVLEKAIDRTSAELVRSVLAPEQARAEAAEAKLAAIKAHAPSITDALRHALSYVEHVPDPSSQAAAERYRDALAIISGEAS